MPLAAHPPLLHALRPHRLGVIEASAGTGKTHLLVHLAVDHVLRGTPIEQLLLVTFTDKATHELARRLRDKLEELVEASARDETVRAPGEPTPADAWTIDARAARRLTDALLSFDRASVVTIHGFCQRALSEQAFAHGLPFEEEHLPEELLFDEVLRDWLRRALARDERARRAIAAWLRPDDTGKPGDFASLREALWAALQAHARHDCVGPPCDESGLLDAARAALEIDRENDWDAPLRAAKVHANTRKAAGDRLTAIQGALCGVSLDDPFAVVAALLPRSGESPFDYLRENAAKLSAVAGPLGILDRLADELVPLSALIAQAFWRELDTALEAAKAERGVFDYQDLLRRLARTLDGPAGPEVTARLRQRYRVAIIDEFQDTDQLQWAIFQRLFADSPDGHALYLIGDPKQAIYDFRGADVHTYLRAREALAARGAPVHTLDVNYRGSGGMVAAQNRLAAALLTTRDLRAPPVSCGRPSRALRTAAGHALSPLHVFEIASAEGGPLRAATLRARLTERIAREIEDLLSARPIWHDGERERQLGPGDIFVLTRSGTEGEEVGQALDARAIPNVALRTESPFSGEEARWLRSALAALERPGDRSARFSAATTGLFDFRLGNVLDEPALLDDSELTATLDHLAELARARAWDALFSALVEDGGIVRRRLFWNESGQDAATLALLLSHLRREIGHARPTLREVVRKLDALRAHPPARLDAPLPSDRAAVIVTTVHKSKGLEAPVVFLFGGFRAFTGQALAHTYVQAGRRHVYLGKPHRETFHEPIRAQRAAEEQRLAYVALTRAAARMYLPFFPAADARDDEDARDPTSIARLDGYYRHVNRALRALLESPRPGEATVEALPCPESEIAATWTPPGHGAPVPASAGAGPPAPAVLETLPVLQAAPAPDAPRAHRLARAHAARGPRTESYSRLKLRLPDAAADALPGLDVSAPLDEAPAPRDGVDDPGALTTAETDALPGGTRTGIFLHELLERVPLSALGRTPGPDYHLQPAVARVFDAALTRHALPESAREPAAALVRAALSRPLPLAAGAGAPRLRGGILALDHPPLRETEFLYPLHGGDYMTGVLDVLFQHEGKVYGLDWKSDRLPAGTSPARQVEEHYRLQARLYATAVLRALGAPGAGAPGRFGGLVYVFLREPGPSGAVFVPPTVADLP